MTGFARIEHFFVLMLENRSFDHLLGTVPGLQQHPLTGQETCPEDPDAHGGPSLPVSHDAADCAELDPPHEFHDVAYQIAGAPADAYATGQPLTMNGFAASGRDGMHKGESRRKKDRLASQRGKGQYALQCHGASSVGILRMLAQEYAVCERWFCSMPGPTWPNRFFVHAASSGGLDNSPSAPRAGGAAVIDELGFDFDHGTIYDRLGEGNWRIYHGDHFPQVLAIKGIVKRRLSSFWRTHFRASERLEDELHEDFTPKYVFIEPNQDVFRHFRHGDSQHPAGLVTAGERLIKRVYEAIRNSPVWEKSALIITYDEHGGFFDRYAPPAAVAPGDGRRNHAKAQFPARFDFELLGVRVPTVIVSPWIARGTVDGQTYDHSSILSTVEKRFGLKPLTRRDESANSFDHLFTEDQPRVTESEAPTHLPDVEEPAGIATLSENIDDTSDDEEPVTGDEAGVLRIAMSVDYLLRTQRASLMRQVFDPVIARTLPAFALVPTPPITTRAEARSYIERVAAQLEATVELPMQGV